MARFHQPTIGDNNYPQGTTISSKGPHRKAGGNLIGWSKNVDNPTFFGHHFDAKCGYHCHCQFFESLAYLDNFSNHWRRYRNRWSNRLVTIQAALINWEKRRQTTKKQLYFTSFSADIRWYFYIHRFAKVNHISA